MDKYLIEVYLPYTEKSYDIYIPQNILIFDATRLISNALEKVTNGVYKSTPNAVLCEKNNCDVLDVNKRAYELNIKNGSKLILI